MCNACSKKNNRHFATEVRCVNGDNCSIDGQKCDVKSTLSIPPCYMSEGRKHRPSKRISSFSPVQATKYLCMSIHPGHGLKLITYPQ